MPKHVVLDSIARSGTTMMSALLRSQEKTVAFCPGFNEPLACNNIAEWPHGICRQDFMDTADIDFDKFQTESLSQIVEYAQYYGLSKDEWRSIIFDANSTSEIRQNMEKALPEVDVFCYRWNQGLSYFHKWLEHGEDFLWLSMIRHPIDRAVSSFEKHNWELQDSLRNTLAFIDKMKEVKHNSKFKLIYYESLVSRPEHVMSEVYDFFGVNLESINLSEIKGSNGEDFIPQSSKMKDVYTKKDGYLTEGDAYSGLYSNHIGRWKSTFYVDNTDGVKKPVITEESYETFKYYLGETEEYSRYF
jgi:hypothetical protein